MRVALITCVTLPEPDSDHEILTSALRALGAEPSLVAWDDPAVKWADFDVGVLRSTWNYFHHADAFLDWVDRAARATKLLNPAAIVRWNAHKSYLRDLEASGVAVVPTEWLAKGDRATVAGIMDSRGWDRVVVKPAVSGGSFGTERVDRGTLARGEAHLAAYLPERDMMVQAYVRSVEDYGERSLVCIDGALSHAVRKHPRFGADGERVSEAMPIAADERAFALQILGGIEQELLYARVDIARNEQGAPMVMELELLEPSLFLRQYLPAADVFARAIVSRALSS